MQIKNFYKGDTNKPHRLNGIDGFAGRGYAKSRLGGEVFAVNDIIQIGDVIEKGYALDFYEYRVADLGGLCRAKLCYLNADQSGSTPSIYLTMVTGLGAAASDGRNFTTTHAGVSGDTIGTGEKTFGAPVKNDVFPALVITAAHAAAPTTGAVDGTHNVLTTDGIVQFGDDCGWVPGPAANLK